MPLRGLEAAAVYVCVSVSVCVCALSALYLFAIVQTKKDKDEYIPMELLDVHPFQRTRAQSAKVASEIVRYAAVSPQERFTKLREYIRHFISM